LDLSSYLGDDDHFNLFRHGNVRLVLRFSVMLPNTVIVIAYSEFDNIIELFVTAMFWSTSEYEY